MEVMVISVYIGSFATTIIKMQREIKDKEKQHLLLFL